MLMWGPLKDTGKEGFSVRRQAEKQQPVYRLILLCAPNLVAASCEAPPLSCPPSPRLTFLAAASCMGTFLEQKQICLVLCHFLSPDPCPFYHVWKLNRESIVRKRMFSLFCLCFVTLCFASYLLCIFCPFSHSLANSQYNTNKRHF